MFITWPSPETFASAILEGKTESFLKSRRVHLAAPTAGPLGLALLFVTFGEEAVLCTTGTGEVGTLPFAPISPVFTPNIPPISRRVKRGHAWGSLGDHILVVPTQKHLSYRSRG